MKDSNYLYGDNIEADRWARMPYRDVLEDKLAKAKELHDELEEHMYNIRVRQHAVEKAINFNKALLEELKDAERQNNNT